MKIAIISDSHDNLGNLKKAICIAKENKVGLIIHCGDVTKPEILRETLRNFDGNFHLVLGNADKGFFNDFKNNYPQYFPQLKIWAKFGEIKIDNKKIAFSHFFEEIKNLAFSEEYDLIFYGHTHKPWEEKVGKTRLVNPGNLSGLFYKAAFAIYDSGIDKLELKIL